jgi:dienelactone hydrolase
LQFPGATTLRRPAGDGPFPAVVLLSTCAGVSSALHEWADRLQTAGYVALVVDSFGPRGVSSVCDSFVVSLDDVAGDALAARDYLRTLAFVDNSRIGAMGFSYGAMAGLRLASAGYMRRATPPNEGFQAIIAVYPFCTPISSSPQYRVIQNNLYDDIKTPLLILIGGDDNETDPIQCAAKASHLVAEGEPVSYHVYPGVTHAFDDSRFTGDRPQRGRYIYRYDKAATEDAADRMRQFFGQNLRR